jgi:hypothetical protein
MSRMHARMGAHGGFTHGMLYAHRALCWLNLCLARHRSMCAVAQQASRAGALFGHSHGRIGRHADRAGHAACSRLLTSSGRVARGQNAMLG